MKEHISGFAFKRRVDPVDWRKLAAVDMKQFEMGLGFEVLQDNLTNVAFCDLEVDIRSNAINVDSCFLKLFRVAQYLIEYLLYSQDYLQEKLTQASGKIETEQKEIKRLSRELFAAKKQWRAAAEKNVREGTIQKCEFCEKRFVNEEYLLAHVERRHNIEGSTKKGTTPAKECVSEPTTAVQPTTKTVLSNAENKNVIVAKQFEDKIAELFMALETLKVEVESAKYSDALTNQVKNISKLEENMNKRIKTLEEIEKRMLLHLDEYKVSCRNGIDQNKVSSRRHVEIPTKSGIHEHKKMIPVPGKYLLRKEKPISCYEEKEEINQETEKKANGSESDSDSGSLLHTQEEVVVADKNEEDCLKSWDYEMVGLPRIKDEDLFTKLSKVQMEINDDREMLIGTQQTDESVMRSKDNSDQENENVFTFHNLSVENEKAVESVHKPVPPPRRLSLEVGKRPSSEPTDSRTGSLSARWPSSMESSTSVWNETNDEDLPEVGQSVEVQELRPRFHSIDIDDVSVESL